MYKRKYTKILLSLFLFTLPSCAHANDDSENEKMNKIADSYLQAIYAYDPDLMTEQKIENARYDIFSDHSLKSIYEFKKYEADTFNALKALNPKQLSGEAQTTYAVLWQYLQASKRVEICKNELWNINTSSPWFSRFVTLAERQPIEGEKAKHDALIRWHGFSVVVDDEIDKLRVGLQLG